MRAATDGLAAEPQVCPLSPPLIAFRDHARPAAVLAALMILSALTEGVGIVLLVPMLGAISGVDTVGGRIARVLATLGLPQRVTPLLALFVALVLARALINHARALAAVRFESGLVDGLRRRALSALLHCDWRVLVTMRQADNASLLITIFDRIGFGVNQAIYGLASAVTLAGMAAAAWVLSPWLALSAAGAGLVVLLLYRGLRSQAMELGETLDAASRQVHRDVSERLAALRVIKSLGRESETEQRSDAGFSALRRAQRRWQHSVALGQATLEGGGSLVLAALVWMALTRWHTPAATLLPMVALFVRALPLLGAVQMYWQNWAYARPALAAARDLIGRTEAAREADPPERDGADSGAPLAPTLTRSITLDRVTLCYAPELPPALDNVSLTIGARETVMISGPSGAGKSTLADLLGGLLSPDAGEVLVDGVPLTGEVRRGWRRRVAYVQQEPVLLSASLRENLLWADPSANNPRLEAALTAASAGFVDDWPEGLDTSIGEGGRRLSGGERQRIMLARALLRDPALLILDEATNALDAVNDAAIAAALSGLKGRLAMVIIGHSGALTGLADRIIELDAGRITLPARAEPLAGSAV